MYRTTNNIKAAVLLVPLEGSPHPQPQLLSIIVELEQNYVLSPHINTSLPTFIITVFFNQQDMLGIQREGGWRAQLKSKLKRDQNKKIVVY